MDFKQKLETYAHLLIEYGLNVQEGQIVNITGEIIHRDFIALLCKAAYQRGAKQVNVDFFDPLLARTRIQATKQDDYLAYVPRYITQKYNEFVEEGAAVLRIIGSEYPEALSDLDPKKNNIITSHYWKALKYYFNEGVGKSKVQWTVAAAATPRWAKKIYPELSEQQAYETLWEEIFKICRADQSNCQQLWEQHNTQLKKRAAYLTNLQIKQLHFTGPETDLKVFLSQKALFIGGGSQGPQGVFEPNIPTEECFTTPDRNFTTGKVKVTRPFPVNGKLIKGLRLEFDNGKLIHFDADEGKENFEKYIETDEGARYLGEVALVGTDSPVFQSGRIFEEILYDENAACHIALGFAYNFCLNGGALLSPEELKAIGCNVSTVHVDMMISNEHVDVDALTHSGQHIKLISKGQWVDNAHHE